MLFLLLLFMPLCRCNLAPDSGEAVEKIHNQNEFMDCTMLCKQ